jgi:hypothetical protein
LIPTNSLNVNNSNSNIFQYVTAVGGNNYLSVNLNQPIGQSVEEKNKILK